MDDRASLVCRLARTDRGPRGRVCCRCRAAACRSSHQEILRPWLLSAHWLRAHRRPAARSRAARNAAPTWSQQASNHWRAGSMPRLRRQAIHSRTCRPNRRRPGDQCSAWTSKRAAPECPTAVWTPDASVCRRQTQTQRFRHLRSAGRSETAPHCCGPQSAGPEARDGRDNR